MTAAGAPNSPSPGPGGERSREDRPSRVRRLPERSAEARLPSAGLAGSSGVANSSVAENRVLENGITDNGLAAGADINVRLMLDFQRTGDPAAFAELVERNQAKVYSIIFRFVLDRTEAEDLAQEVFLRVYRTAARYTPTAKFSTWLYRIAVNVSLNALRSRARTRMVSLAPNSDDPEEFTKVIEDTRQETPTRGPEDQELRDHVAAAIESLPENQRIAIVLNKFEGLSYDEIAAVLNLSMMAVKSLLSRARNNLKDTLDPYLDERE